MGLLIVSALILFVDSYFEYKKELAGVGIAPRKAVEAAPLKTKAGKKAVVKKAVKKKTPVKKAEKPKKKASKKKK